MSRGVLVIELDPKTAIIEPQSATPDTDSPPSADHDTASENSSNTQENTDPSPSDASDANHKSATADLRRRLLDAAWLTESDADNVLTVFADWLQERAAAFRREDDQVAADVLTHVIAETNHG